jgi:hypothetical protein
MVTAAVEVSTEKQCRVWLFDAVVVGVVVDFVWWLKRKQQKRGRSK